MDYDPWLSPPVGVAEVEVEAVHGPVEGGKERVRHQRRLVVLLPQHSFEAISQPLIFKVASDTTACGREAPSDLRLAVLVDPLRPPHQHRPR